MPSRKQAKYRVPTKMTLLVIIFLIKLLARTNIFNDTEMNFVKREDLSLNLSISFVSQFDMAEYLILDNHAQIW